MEELCGKPVAMEDWDRVKAAGLMAMEADRKVWREEPRHCVACGFEEELNKNLICFKCWHDKIYK